MIKANIKSLLTNLVPGIFLRFRHLRHIAGYKDLIHDLKADHASRKIDIKFGNHLFFIAGMPKSGSTWLQQLLSSNRNLVKLNSSFLRSFPIKVKLGHPHNLNNLMFSCAPKNKFSLLKLHPHPSKSNLDILKKNNVKTVILIRDIRDVLVSDYFHSIVDKKDYKYSLLKGLSAEDALLKSVKTINAHNDISDLEYYVNWLDGWVKESEKNPLNTLIIKYEEMHANLADVLKRIYNFYEYDINIDDINSLIVKHRLKHIQDLKGDFKKNLRKKGSYISTYRNGQINTWNQFFDTMHNPYIKKRISGILIKTGYEKDNSW
jgi:hypothetical protein